MEANKGIKYLGRDNRESNLNPSWILSGLHTDEKSIAWAQGFAYHLAVTDETSDLLRDTRGKEFLRANLSTSQLRKFFGEIKRIQAQEFDPSGKWLAEVRMLKPKLAYAVGREKNKDPKIYDFYRELEIGINAITKQEHFQTFVQLLEAIVAYHKFFEKSVKLEQNEQN